MSLLGECPKIFINNIEASFEQKKFIQPTFFSKEVKNKINLYKVFISFNNDTDNNSAGNKAALKIRNKLFTED